MIRILTKVLIVDDERDFVEMFSLRLQETGERVYTAYSGQESLDILSGEDIDVVVLDIRMPGMDGIETLKEIKKRHPIVEVILLTGHGAIETAVAGMKLEAYDYLLKPADAVEMAQNLEGARKRKDEQMDRIRKAEQRTLLRRGGNI